MLPENLHRYIISTDIQSYLKYIYSQTQRKEWLLWVGDVSEGFKNICAIWDVSDMDTFYSRGYTAIENKFSLGSCEQKLLEWKQKTTFGELWEVCIGST